jgi:hypothetical protein
MALASEEKRDGDFLRADEPPIDDRLLVKWLEEQSESSQTALVFLNDSKSTTNDFM